MLRAASLLTVTLALLGAVSARAQSVCPANSSSTNLICVIPQLYSTSGVDLPNAAHRAHFDNDFNQRATALNAAIGTELASLRLASPASGIVFTFDRGLGVVTRSTESYGPILGERAETVGRHRLFVAVTYQFFPFSSLDGIDLKHVPAVYTHVDGLNPDGTSRTSTDAASPGNPGIEREYITTDNRIDLKVHQVTFYTTFGITSRLDVSAAIPVENVRMGMTSNATINRSDDPLLQPLSPSTDPTMQRFYASTGPALNCAQTSTCSGFFHYFNDSDPAGSVNATFKRFESATGIGDLVFRVKGTVLKGERAGLALGGDLRLATGDEKNFLGAGATGFKPFLSASYRARVSPHVSLGYEFNGSSILAGDITTGTTGRLPNQLFYSFGADAGITKKLSAAVDLLGQHLYGAPRVQTTPFVDVVGQTHADDRQIVETRGSFNINDLAVGAKYVVAGNFMLKGNLTIKLDDGGLRAKVVPLVGLSYTF